VADHIHLIARRLARPRLGERRGQRQDQQRSNRGSHARHSLRNAGDRKRNAVASAWGPKDGRHRTCSRAEPWEDQDLRPSPIIDTIPLTNVKAPGTIVLDVEPLVSDRFSVTLTPAVPAYLARFGPTTPTRAGRLADASVDPTEARKAAVRRFGRSDRSAQC